MILIFFTSRVQDVLLSSFLSVQFPCLLEIAQTFKFILFGLWVCCSLPKTSHSVLPLPQSCLCIQAVLRSQLKCHLLKEAFYKLPIRVALLVTFTLLLYLLHSIYCYLRGRLLFACILSGFLTEMKAEQCVCVCVLIY